METEVPLLKVLGLKTDSWDCHGGEQSLLSHLSFPHSTQSRALLWLKSTFHRTLSHFFLMYHSQVSGRAPGWDSSSPLWPLARSSARDPWDFPSPCVPVVKPALTKAQHFRVSYPSCSQSLLCETGGSETKRKKERGKQGGGKKKGWEWSCVC